MSAHCQLAGRARLAERAHFKRFNGEFIRHPHESTTIYFHLLWKQSRFAYRMKIGCFAQHANFRPALESISICTRKAPPPLVLCGCSRCFNCLILHHISSGTQSNAAWPKSVATEARRNSLAPRKSFAGRLMPFPWHLQRRIESSRISRLSYCRAVHLHPSLAGQPRLGVFPKNLSAISVAIVPVMEIRRSCGTFGWPLAWGETAKDRYTLLPRSVHARDANYNWIKSSRSYSDASSRACEHFPLDRWWKRIVSIVACVCVPCVRERVLNP